MSKCTCQHPHILTDAPAQRPMVNGLQVLNQFDPTQTTTLRNRFVSDMNKRFTKVRGLIRKAIVEQDCFGLKRNGIDAVMNNVAGLPGHRAFAFERTSAKIEGFMEWLEEQVNANILERVVDHGTPLRTIGRGSIEHAWSDVYVSSAYTKGINDSRTAMFARGYEGPGLGERAPFSSLFNQPVHADRLGVLYTRTYSELKGITAQMDQQISRVLAQGMAEQRGPADIARMLTRTISGQVGDLALTDTLGRFIPAQRRAMIMARTEIIRAHHMGNIQEMKNFGIAGVEVQAEFRTAGDDRVCSLCASMQGNIYTLEQIEGMIPVHPQCRCRAYPITKRMAREMNQTTVPTPTSTPSARREANQQLFRDTKWGTDVTDPTKIREKLKTQFNVSQVNGLTKTSPDWRIKYANETGKALDNVYTAVPTLAPKARRRSKGSRIKLNITNDAGVAHGVSNGTMAYYMPGSNSITTLRRSMERTTPSLYIGKGHNVGLDYASTIRHEYGHMVHEKLLTKAQVAKIEHTFATQGKRTISSGVSEYAATSPHEMFAEVFSAWTSPLYKKIWSHAPGHTTLSGRVLPDWAEQLMKETVGDRVGI